MELGSKEGTDLRNAEIARGWGLPNRDHHVSKGKEICPGKTCVRKQTLLGHHHGRDLVWGAPEE